MTFGCRHHFFPFQIAEDGDYHVKCVKAGFEWDFFIEIKATGDHIDGYPNKPLLEVFVRQSPNSDDAQGSGETVGDWHVAVGEVGEYQINNKPYHADYSNPRKD